LKSVGQSDSHDSHALQLLSLLLDQSNATTKVQKHTYVRYQ
jgi:hypothetical protein